MEMPTHFVYLATEGTKLLCFYPAVLLCILLGFAFKFLLTVALLLPSLPTVIVITYSEIYTSSKVLKTIERIFVLFIERIEMIGEFENVRKNECVPPKDVNKSYPKVDLSVGAKYDIKEVNTKESGKSEPKSNDLIFPSTTKSLDTEKNHFTILPNDKTGCEELFEKLEVFQQDGKIDEPNDSAEQGDCDWMEQIIEGQRLSLDSSHTCAPFVFEGSSTSEVPVQKDDRTSELTSSLDGEPTIESALLSLNRMPSMYNFASQDKLDSKQRPRALTSFARIKQCIHTPVLQHFRIKSLKTATPLSSPKGKDLIYSTSEPPPKIRKMGKKSNNASQMTFYVIDKKHRKKKSSQ